MWVEKYRPQSIEEVVGNTSQREKLVGWLRTWHDNDTPAVIIDGPPGTGKTSSAHAVSRDLDLETFEINASDLRNRANLEKTLTETCVGGSFGVGRLIIVDEADNLDRGGSGVLRTAIDETDHPIVLITNDLWGGVKKSIRKRCEILDWDEPESQEISRHLETIIDREDIVITEEALDLITDKSEGDVRQAVNRLESACGETSRLTRGVVHDMWGTLPRHLWVWAEGEIDPEILRDMSGLFEDVGRVSMRGWTPAEIVWGEWLHDRGIEVAIHPPRDDHLEGVWELRYDTLTSECLHMETWTRGEISWDDYIDEVVSWPGIESVMTWNSEREWDRDEIPISDLYN